jgi:hypothetical protein
VPTGGRARNFLLWMLHREVGPRRADGSADLGWPETIHATYLLRATIAGTISTGLHEQPRRNMMSEVEFRQHLRDRKLSEDQISQHVDMVRRLDAYLVDSRRQGGMEKLTVEDARELSRRMMSEGLNTYDNYLALARYARFTGNDDVFVAFAELIDGSEAMEVLYGKLGDRVGEAVRDAVFEGVELPPLGTLSSDRCAITRVVMEGLERLVDGKICKSILSSGLRRLDADWYLEERKKFHECSGIDEYLERRGQAFLEELEHIKSKGALYFTQPVTDGVIEFVRRNPAIRQGVREGGILYEVKIPYMAADYLAETDPALKRYFYCHCPWVRESLKSGEMQISPTFCHCSAGFHKKVWDVIFDQPLEAEIVETVLRGDPWCKIAIHLPESILGAGSASD